MPTPTPGRATGALSADLAAYAARLLTGTGLSPDEALQAAAASGHGDLAHPDPVVRALRDGWAAPDHAAPVAFGPAPPPADQPNRMDQEGMPR